MAQMRQIHAQMVSTGLISDGFALSRLVAFCAISEWRNLDYCDKLLDNAPNPNIFSWNVAIRGYLESENPRNAVFLYRKMLRKGGSIPDNYSYPLLFKACAGLSLSFTANEILGHVVHLGFYSDLFVHNAIIHVLVSCGELLAARKVFDESCVRDLVSWNSMINGYVRCGLADEALNLYYKMEDLKVKPDEVTMIGLVSASAQLENVALGRKLHQFIEEMNIEAAETLFENMTKKTIVSWTTMVVGYAKCGMLESAVRLFNEMPEKDVVPWNALIGGFVQAKRSKEALALFHEMQASNVDPDEVTVVSCLSACSQLGALDVGIWMHRFVDKQNLTMNVALGTALVDMYAKCGNIKKALQNLGPYFKAFALIQKQKRGPMRSFDNPFLNEA
ncbi:Pentatricopeptide repeat-containing protein, mitochondrial, partial [Cucurbita argyrosperma subsp. argyrosperma]